MPGIRPRMEDGSVIKDGYLGVERQSLVAVFDGHGETKSMERCRDNLQDYLAEALNEFPEDMT
jgi:serine/threonine protein phosphatase PrpC